MHFCIAAPSFPSTKVVDVAVSPADVAAFMDRLAALDGPGPAGSDGAMQVLAKGFHETASGPVGPVPTFVPDPSYTVFLLRKF